MEESITPAFICNSFTEASVGILQKSALQKTGHLYMTGTNTEATGFYLYKYIIAFLAKPQQ